MARTPTTPSRAATAPLRPAPRVQLEKRRWMDAATLDLNDALDKLFPVDALDNASPVEAIRLAAREDARLARVEAVREVVRAVHRGLIDGGRVLPHPESTTGADALGWLMYAAGYRWPTDVKRATQTLTELRLYAALTRPRRALDTYDLERLLPRTSSDQPRSIPPLLQIEVLTVAVAQRDLPATSQALRLLQLTLDQWLADHASVTTPASV